MTDSNKNSCTARAAKSSIFQKLFLTHIGRASRNNDPNSHLYRQFTIEDLRAVSDSTNLPPSLKNLQPAADIAS
ncbi:hypothetical protein [Hornefia butyriciproducens]|uniref:hypothetical protein n=1 Tax=Hornefia butyriciproducens TaxID=2652293 RepID=UPI003F89E2FB